MTGIGLPKPLRPGDRVRLAAASSALDAAALNRLDRKSVV